MLGRIRVVTAAAVALLMLTTVAARPVAAQAGVEATISASSPHEWCLAGGIELANCRLAQNGSVKVFWNDPALIDARTADALIDSTIEAMGRYQTLGFDAADISGLNRVDIAVLPGDDSPLYSWKLGSISLGAVSARALAATGAEHARLELWHELFHWIQDESYVMGWARLNGDLAWWQETTAEIGTFLIDPGAAAHNANLYGRSSLSDMSTLVFQLSPLQWLANEQYLHAQRIWASMCPAGCALSQQSFTAAVNAGTYPLSDETTRQAFSNGIDGYARYLLTGESKAMPLVEPFASGNAIGDYLAIVQDRGGAPWRVESNGGKPQIDKAAGSVTAELQPDSVYPLLVASGAAAEAVTGIAYPLGQPAMLVIEPGTEVFYRLDSGKVQQHKGADELRLGPIHGAMGIGKVRVVAIARSGPATLKARLEPIDLSGDWVFDLGKKVRVVSSTCPVDKQATRGGSKDDLLRLFTSFAAAPGTYHPVAEDEPGELRYTLDAGREFRPSAGDPPMTYSSEIRVGEQEVTVELAFDTGRPTGALPIALLAAILPFGLLGYTRRRPLVPIALLVIGGLLSGCAGIDLDGSMTATMRFGSLEWAGPKAKPKAPQWSLGKGTGTLVLDVEVTVGQGKQKDKQRCVVEVAFSPRGSLYRDGVVKPPKL